MAKGDVIIGMDDLIRRLELMKKVGSKNTMQALGDAFVESAQAKVPIDSPEHSAPPKHPSALHDSIKVAYAAPRAVGIVAGGPDAPYAEAIERGSPAHQIRARADKLKFFWIYKNPPKPGGVSFKGFSVSHPGNDPIPFFEPTMDEFRGAGLAGFFRGGATKTISMIDTIRVDLINHWNAGA